MLARKRARAARQQRGALIIQRNWKMAIQRFRYWQTRTAVMHIQAAWRGHVARTVAFERRWACHSPGRLGVCTSMFESARGGGGF